jgi:AcrR family transcriptional regulator
MSTPNPESKPLHRAGSLDWIRPARQKRTQRALEAVLDAAQQLANERPFDEIPVVEICKAASCSVPGFYRRFADKEALLQALHTRHVTEAIATAQVALDSERWEGASLGEILAAVIALVSRIDSRASGLRVTAARRAVMDERFAERTRAARSAVFERLRDLLRARRDEFAHRDPDLAAKFLIRMTYGVLIRQSDSGAVDARVHPLSDRELVEELTCAALAYLGVEDSSAVRRGSCR